MLSRGYAGQNCSIARALEVVGERWTLLLVRDMLLGITRFEDFQRHLGMATNVLTDRLSLLVDEGVVIRDPYQERPERFHYRLTAKGRELYSVIGALMAWGDRHYAPDGPPLLLGHEACGGSPAQAVTCADCGEDLTPDNIVIIPTPRFTMSDR